MIENSLEVKNFEEKLANNVDTVFEELCEDLTMDYFANNKFEMKIPFENGLNLVKKLLTIRIKEEKVKYTEISLEYLNLDKVNKILSNLIKIYAKKIEIKLINTKRILSQEEIDDYDNKKWLPYLIDIFQRNRKKKKGMLPNEIFRKSPKDQYPSSIIVFQCSIPTYDFQLTSIHHYPILNRF